MLDFLAERKLAEAVSRGELDDLPGAGEPLALDDDPLVRVERAYFKKVLRRLR